MTTPHRTAPSTYRRIAIYVLSSLLLAGWGLSVLGQPAWSLQGEGPMMGSRPAGAATSMAPVILDMKYVRHKFEHTAAVAGIAFSPDGKLLACGGDDKYVRIYDLATGKQVKAFNRKVYVRAVAFSPDGKAIAVAAGDSDLRMIDIETGKDLATFTGHEAGVSALAFTRDGKRLISIALDDSVRVLDAATGKVIHELKPKTAGGLVQSLALPADDKMVWAQATMAATGGLYGWNLVDGKLVAEWKPSLMGEAATQPAARPPGRRSAFAGSSDGKQLAIGRADGLVSIVDPSTGRVTQAFKFNPTEVYGLAFSPDGKMLAVRCSDAVIYLCDLASGQSALELSDTEGTLYALAFSPDGRLLASGTTDGNLVVWDVSSVVGRGK